MTSQVEQMGNDINEIDSFGLFAVPNFSTGAARIFDFRNRLNMYNKSQGSQAADDDATRRDWHAVGEDLRAATAQQ